MNAIAQGRASPVEWLQQVTGKQSIPAIAREVHRSHTTLYRWRRAGVIPADAVVSIAVQYGFDLVDALIATGWLSPDDAKEVNLQETLRRLPAVQLTAELHRRAIRRADHGNGTNGI